MLRLVRLEGGSLDDVVDDDDDDYKDDDDDDDGGEDGDVDGGLHFFSCSGLSCVFGANEPC